MTIGEKTKKLFKVKKFPQSIQKIQNFKFLNT